MVHNENLPRSKWLASGGKITQVVRLQNVDDPGGGVVGSLSIHRKVIKVKKILSLTVKLKMIFFKSIE